MAQGHLFLYGEDTLEDVREIRLILLSNLSRGLTTEWTDENLSVKKAAACKLATDEILRECNYFLRLYDPAVRALNPVVKTTKVMALY
jgi:hypothetical protein